MTPWRKKSTGPAASGNVAKIYNGSTEMRFKKLTIEGKKIDVHLADRALEDAGIDWLVDCEFEDADVDVTRGTVIWNDGTLYSGRWHFGIWKEGEFNGTWDNGIFESGSFRGRFVSGIIDRDLLR